MSCTYEKKGSLLASFFIGLLACVNACSEPLPAVPKAQREQLAESPQWRALLHWDNKASHISDPAFILSHNNPGLISELDATLQYLYTPVSPGGQPPQCRFPARYIFLQHHLGLPQLDLASCAELVEFERRAPANKIDLVFASENISIPTSMMGHVFLKLSDDAPQGTTEHAVSFFTDSQDTGIAGLIYKTMVTGKPGFISLRPYQEVIQRYNQRENRNIWEYRLATTDFTRTLIHYHLYELKQTQLTYFFDSYNCATLTQYVVALVGAKPEHNSLVTPVDVVKFATDNQLIVDTRLHPSPSWKIRMLAEALDDSARKTVSKAIRQREIHSLGGDIRTEFLQLKLAEEVANYSLAQTADEQLLEWRSLINSRQVQLPNYDIDVHQYKSPLKTPGDSQFTLGLRQRHDEDYLVVRYLPAAHRLEDDNRQYFGETELTLADISLAASTTTGRVQLESFTLYGASSFIPRDEFLGGMSGRFKFGMEQELERDQHYHHSGYLDVALGSSFALADDIQIYSLAGMSLAATGKHIYAKAYPEIGLVINEVWAMKSSLHLRRVITTSNEVPDSSQLNFTQSFYISQANAGFLSVDAISNYQQTEKSVSLLFKHYF